MMQQMSIGILPESFSVLYTVFKIIYFTFVSLFLSTKKNDATKPLRLVTFLEQNMPDHSMT